MTGNLSHQIEHHLFPDLPSNRYAEIAPQVQALFEKYGLTYHARPLPQQVYSRLAQGRPALAAQRLARDHDRAQPAEPAQAALQDGHRWAPGPPRRPGPDGPAGQALRGPVDSRRRLTSGGTSRRTGCPDDRAVRRPGQAPRVRPRWTGCPVVGSGLDQTARWAVILAPMTSTPASPPASVWGDESDAVRAILDWVSRRVWKPTDPMTGARPAAELAAATGCTVTPEGIGADRALALFDEVLLPATRAMDDPANWAYIPCAPTRTATTFDMATGLANIFAGLWESGAGAIHAENQALRWVADLLGWPPDAGGCFVSGGTSGNLSALVAARHTAQAARVAAGLPAVPVAGWALACTRDAHSSIRTAAQVMGIDVVAVPGDERGRLTGPALRAALDAQADRDGSGVAEPRVFAVVASAGTTNAGIVDDLAGIATECERDGIWLHVDGAYGGAALAAPSVRPLFAGIERADSFIVDPHKWLFAPYDCCALVYRRPELALAAHAQHAGYLDDVDRAAWNPADLAVHLTRRPRGLPLWFSLAVHGTDAYTAAVEAGLSTARAVAEGVRSRPFLRLVMEPMLSVVVLERPGWDLPDYQRWSHGQAVDGGS